MLDLGFMKKHNITSYSIAQKIFALLFLFPNYYLFRKVDIKVEGADNIPKKENVIFAMNHTDRFNYWPFQFYLLRNGYPETTVWVKGKYYRHPLLAKGFNLANCIPVPSIGYLIEEFHYQRSKKYISKEDYRTIKDAIDGIGCFDQDKANAILGIHSVSLMKEYYEQIMSEVARLTRMALFEKHISLIIFPEGTRTIKIKDGLTGIAQVALHTKKLVVPVACNNSEQIYPGSSPVAQSGQIIYRIGKPMSVNDDFSPYRINEPFNLLSKHSQIKYKENFEGATKLIMSRINEMLDEKYQQ
ncbi:MAG: lysophospholipid acyltransferase family protein [Deltaproteobacteria bacterium]